MFIEGNEYTAENPNPYENGCKHEWVEDSFIKVNWRNISLFYICKKCKGTGQSDVWSEDIWIDQIEGKKK